MALQTTSMHKVYDFCKQRVIIEVRQKFDLLDLWKHTYCVIQVFTLTSLLYTQQNIE